MTPRRMPVATYVDLQALHDLIFGAAACVARFDFMYKASTSPNFYSGVCEKTTACLSEQTRAIAWHAVGYKMYSNNVKIRTGVCEKTTVLAN